MCLLHICGVVNSVVYVFMFEYSWVFGLLRLFTLVYYVGIGLLLLVFCVFFVVA